MTLISNDPSWWPLINLTRISSYFVVASSAGVMYDWALSFGQEVELVWRQRWSLMTVLYLSVRYVGIIYIVISIMLNVPTIPVTPVVSYIMYVTRNWTNVAVFVILGVIMITRLHAMYQGSRMMLIFLVVVFLAVKIATVVITAISMSHISEDVLILSGTYQCTVDFQGSNDSLLVIITSTLTTAWEVLVLCLAVWIAVKHFRELQRSSTGWIIEDYFMVLMKTHVIYFASFVVVSCLHLIYLSPMLSANLDSLENHISVGVLQIFLFVQMFVLGPRLILGVRHYHAELLAGSDAGTAMTSIFFQERVHVSTCSSV
ncbi:uncharacterized protein EDB91DRAFT_878893 [Suillus paluster]|uniref:uncharacterized protein n=1 Tax=Suillus paluster TaxID=48578 RepID=UPI001B87F31A|nr:uncharacterized protein EDB91DRAFT_878893 [Suillus paluster]KAG1748431.1 hypothetical protein EDB91DRAFT_878893 [Suillus paluster]